MASITPTPLKKKQKQKTNKKTNKQTNKKKQTKKTKQQQQQQTNKKKKTTTNKQTKKKKKKKKKKKTFLIINSDIHEEIFHMEMDFFFCIKSVQFHWGPKLFPSDCVISQNCFFLGNTVSHSCKT